MTNPKRRPTLILSAAVAIAVALTSCAGGGNPAPTDGSPADGGTIHIAWNSQPPTLDPVATSSYSTRDIVKNVFESLVALDENWTPQPVLASSAVVSDDNKTFTFELRTDVTFHNGEPMTAADVVASVERWISDSAIGQRFFVDATVTEDADSTVSIHTAEPLAEGLTLLADAAQQLAIMPAAAIAEKTDTGVTELIGTGPYALGEWVKDRSITLTKFDDYVSPAGATSGLAGEKVAHADELVFDLVPDASTRLAGLQSGQYDISYQLSNDNLNQVEGDPNLQAISETGSFGGLVFNKAEGPSTDVMLRRAIMTALDAESVAIAGFGPEFIELDGALSPVGSPAYTDAALDRYNQADPAAAKAILAESDYAGQTLRFIASRDFAGNYQQAVEIQQQLEAIGIVVDVQTMDGATLMATRAEPSKFDMFMAGWNQAPTPIVYTPLQPTYPGWTDDPDITAAMAAVNSAADEAQIADAYAQLQESVYDYVPFVKFENYNLLTGASVGVSDIRFLMGPIFYDVSLTD